MYVKIHQFKYLIYEFFLEIYPARKGSINNLLL